MGDPDDVGEGLPWERTQPPLCGGAIYGLSNQLESHLVVHHLRRDAEKRREGMSEEVLKVQREQGKEKASGALAVSCLHGMVRRITATECSR